MFNFDVLRSEAGKFQSELRKKKSKLNELFKQREHLTTAPLQRGCIIKMLQAQLDFQAKRDESYFPTGLRMSLEYLLKNPMQKDLSVSHQNIIGTRTGVSRPDVIPTENFIFFFADILKSRLADAVNEMDWPDAKCGPPLSERKKQLPILDKQIQELEKEIIDLTAQGEAAGLHAAIVKNT